MAQCRGRTLAKHLKEAETFEKKVMQAKAASKDGIVSHKDENEISKKLNCTNHRGNLPITIKLYPVVHGVEFLGTTAINHQRLLSKRIQSANPERYQRLIKKAREEKKAIAVITIVFETFKYIDQQINYSSMPSV